MITPDKPSDSLPDTRKSHVKNTGITVLALIAVFSACFFAAAVLLQILLSFYLFFLLNPLVEWAIQKKVSRKISSPFVVLLMVVLMVGGAWGSYGAVSKLAQEIPQYTGKIKKTIRALEGQADQIQKNTSGIIPQSAPKDDVQKVEVVQRFDEGTSEAVLHGAGSLAELIEASFLIPILLLFLLLEKPYLQMALSEVVPRDFRQAQVGRALSEMVTGFIFGNILVGLGTATGFYIIFTILHLENRLLLALVAGFMNLIPMVGAVLAGLFPMAQAYLQFESLNPALTILGSSIFLHFFVANFIIPKIVGSKINVNATSATVGLIFWGWLWGPIGLLLAVPLMATIRIFLSSRKSSEHWGKLIAENSSGAMTRMSLSQQKTTS
jgi:predicted PurR-regulated permease PerM